jgi:phosphatidylglycerol:prolipoprotein diacylglycerol transferase
MEAGTNYIQVHPTFLYEGMWNLMVFFILVICLKKKIKRFHGELFLVYLAGYGIGRAIIENIRTDQLYIPGTKVPVSMVLGIVVAAASIITIIVGRKRFTLINSAEESEQETEEESGPKTEEETGADVGQEAEREPEEDTEEDSEEEYGADTKEKTE